MKIKTAYLILKTDRSVDESASKLRGYIASKFGYRILSNHSNGGFIYSYPRVQYKIIGGTPSILGIENGARVLKDISDEIDELKLKNRYRVEQIIIYEQKFEIRETKKMIEYRFITPWLALNQGSYKRYQEIRDWKERKEFLNRILVGNILSMCKGLGIVVGKHLSSHTHLNVEKVEFKAIPMIGFTGKFRVNFAIPDFFGLGKGVSQGSGTVRRKGTG
ncbi:MAG TPA: hypothetical protein EYP30_04240 [Archaeoglobaceae archaeon]|nr:hypothetical protein [Archaeoglobaceae archaeon]